MNAESPPARAAEHDVAGVAGRAGLQLHQLEDVAAVERQLADALLVDERRNAALLGVDQPGLRFNRDGLAERADLEREVEADGVADGEQHARLRDGAESVQLGRDVVGAAREVGDAVEPSRPETAVRSLAGGGIADGDSGAGHDGPRTSLTAPVKLAPACACAPW